MSGVNSKKQDMPPPGGYQAISYKRIPARSFFPGWALIGAYLGITAASAYVFHLTRKEIHNEEIEMRSANFAIYPMLLAERDREYLKQLRRNREEEAELMKNVEGWKVGTYYGEPLYKLQPEDKLVEPTFAEYYVHTEHKNFFRRAFMSMLS